MNEFLDALEGAVALVCGGFIFLLFGRTLQATGFIDLTFWGIIYVLVGILVTITVIATATGAVISEVV